MTIRVGSRQQPFVAWRMHCSPCLFGEKCLLAKYLHQLPTGLTKPDSSTLVQSKWCCDGANLPLTPSVLVESCFQVSFLGEFGSKNRTFAPSRRSQLKYLSAFIFLVHTPHFLPRTFYSEKSRYGSTWLGLGKGGYFPRILCALGILRDWMSEQVGKTVSCRHFSRILWWVFFRLPRYSRACRFNNRKYMSFSSSWITNFMSSAVKLVWNMRLHFLLWCIDPFVLTWFKFMHCEWLRIDSRSLKTLEQN